MPHVCVAGTQQVRAVENAIIGQFGASGGGGVHVPLTMLPQMPITWSAQHATGGVLDKPGFGAAGEQVIVPQVTVAAGAPAVPVPAVPVPAVPVPAVPVPVPAAAEMPPLPAAEVPAVSAGVPAAAAPAVVWPGVAEGSSPPHATRPRPNSTANQETRTFILAIPTSTRSQARLGPSGTPSTPLAARAWEFVNSAAPALISYSNRASSHALMVNPLRTATLQPAARSHCCPQRRPEVA
jgi:hypothetical protein